METWSVSGIWTFHLKNLLIEYGMGGEGIPEFTE
jgi:hypothetical protein